MTKALLYYLFMSVSELLQQPALKNPSI